MAQRVMGLEDTLRTLQQIDPVLVRQARKRMKDDLKPVVAAARGTLPAGPPLSKWVASKRSVVTSGVRRYGERKGSGEGSPLPVWESARANRRIGIMVQRKRVKGFTGRRALVALRQTDAAGQALDMAGKVTSTPFSRNLTARFGPPSRGMWPAVEKNRSKIDSSMEKSKREMEGVINSALRSRSGGYDKGVYEQFRGMGYTHQSSMQYARKYRWI